MNRRSRFVTSGMVGLFAIGIMFVPAARLQAQPQTATVLAFEVASVKLTPPGSSGLTSFSPPGAAKFTATNVSLELLVGMAFGIDETQILGQPSWFGSERYDINAKPDGDAGLTYEQLRLPLQRLLEVRFGLATHREMKDIQGYALVIVKGGPKLQPTKGASAQAFILRGGLRGQNLSMDTFAAMLARPAGRPVIDQTGIKGSYDIKLDYAPDDATDSPLPSFFTALQEQLGLKLASQKVPVEMLVIDRVNRVPTEN